MKNPGQNKEQTEWLSDMALFVEVARTKAFGKAADKLGIARSTLSVRISKLEQHMGRQLLSRTTRRVELTDAGRLYYEKAARIVEEARLAHQQLGELLAEPAGVLRVTMPSDFAQLILAPLLPGFCARHPQMALELHLSPRQIDLAGEPFDIALRMGEQPDSTLLSRKLAELGGGLYAAPAYLAARGVPHTPQDLAQHACLRFHTGWRDEWPLLGHAKPVSVTVQGPLLTNSPGMNLRLAEAGLGIAALPHVMAQAATAANKLQRVLPGWHSPPVPVYAVTAARLPPAKTRAFIDFLAEHLPTLQLQKQEQTLNRDGR